MHPQIHEVIRKLATGPKGIRVCLTAGESTPLGNILNIVYYRTSICEVIDRENRDGYPHNGGQHTFNFHGPSMDAVSMLELIKETVLDNFKLNEEERRVANELSFVSQEILSLRRKTRTH